MIGRGVSPRIFLPDALATPVRGTVRWEGSRAMGVWGDPDNPVRLSLFEADGTVRPVTRAEMKMIRRIWPRYVWEVAP